MNRPVQQLIALLCTHVAELQFRNSDLEDQVTRQKDMIGELNLKIMRMENTDDGPEEVS